MQPNPSYLVWLDLEMTGLNPEIERIIEMAAIITDQDLHIVAQSSEIVIHQSDELLNRMDAWNTSHHTQSGLVDQVKQSQISEKQAEEQLLEFVAHYVPKGKSPLCGNTIYQDRRFLAKYMPTLEQFFHYRNLDVSTIKILAQRWNPAITKVREVEKDSRHRALQDIRDSINELKYYREHFFKLGN